MEDYRDEADEAEDLQCQEDVLSPETPEADALDQAAALQPDSEENATTSGNAPEADALEQRRAVGDDQDDDERR